MPGEMKLIAIHSLPVDEQLVVTPARESPAQMPEGLVLLPPFPHQHDQVRSGDRNVPARRPVADRNVRPTKNATKEEGTGMSLQ